MKVNRTPIRYAVRVASKKRKPPQRRQGKGLSGNPQRRAQQLQERGATGHLGQQSRWAGSFEPASRQTWPWWAESHETVLAQVRAAEWPSGLLDIEALAGRLAGDEFHARVNAPGSGTGLTPAGWLQALTGTAADAMAGDLAAHGKSWPQLWAFCCGLAGEESAEDLAAEAAAIADRGLIPVPGIPVPWYQPTEGDDALVARDAYGDRFLLVAPFSEPGQPAAPDHWYAWDLDWCADGLVVAAGAYGSAAAALAEWRAAVGPAAAADLAPCAPELRIRLLDPALGDSLQAESVLGDEPAEFFREVPRLFRRAAAVADSLGHILPRKRSSRLADGRDAAIENFLDWHAGHAWNSPDARDAAEGALELILAEWGPDVPPDERVFYACSPHRIETCTSVLRDSYEPDWVNKALHLLPYWVQWCTARTALDAECADRALAAAHAEAAAQVGEHHVVAEGEAPFRRPE
jgi:hypothetical protein